MIKQLSSKDVTKEQQPYMGSEFGGQGGVA